MKALAQTLSEMIFKDIKVSYDLSKALKSSSGKIKFNHQSDPTAQQILETTEWSILETGKTTSSLPDIKNYAAYLLTQSYLNAGEDASAFYHKENYATLMSLISLDKYDRSKLA